MMTREKKEANVTRKKKQEEIRVHFGSCLATLVY